MSLPLDEDTMGQTGVKPATSQLQVARSIHLELLVQSSNINKSLSSFHGNFNN